MAKYKVDKVRGSQDAGGKVLIGKFCIVIPTYNEAENLPKLIMEIENLLRTYDFTLIVVDDASPDGTAQVAETLNGLYGNIVVRRRTGKLGIGSAISEGLKTALAMDEVKFIVTLDGDLSHNPKEVPKLLRAAEKADLVQGSRYVNEGHINGWSPTRRLVSLIANIFCRIFFGNSVHEYTGNFRVYSRECTEVITNFTRCKGFEWVVEALVTAKRHGFTVKEVPITFSNRRNGKTKLRAKDVVSWFFFAAKTMLPVFPTFSGFIRSSVYSFSEDHSKSVIQKSSTINETSTAAPIVSTTMYTLSSESPDLSDHARSVKCVKSRE